MPFVNGKFYANLLYGNALERARAADEGRAWSEDPDAEATPEIMLVGAHPAQAHGSGHHRQQANGPDDYDAATTPEGVANQIYNETSGLRATVKIGTGPGTDWDMQQARKSIAHVVQNRAEAGIRGGLAADHLAPPEMRAIGTIASPAYDAHGASLAAAHDAARHRDPTGGARFFYLDHGQPSPSWAAGRQLVGDFGPFSNTSGKGRLKNAPTRIKVYK